MKKHPKLATILAASMLFTADLSIAATTLINETWDAPDIPGRTQVDNTATFAGWDLSSPRGNIFKIREAGDNGVPGAAGNQALQFEWNGTNAKYDTSHNWSATDQYTLNFNATEQSWSNTNNRYLRVAITEIGTSATIWSQQVTLPQLDSAHDGAGESWSAAQTFQFNIDAAADFTGGTVGNALRFEVGGIDGAAPNNRGMFVDNITFELLDVVAIPEPSTTAILSLGAIALILRRRK